MNYFIADTHFGHENIIRMCERPFDNVEQMNQKIIENWNSKIKGNDHVHILGDMFFRCAEPETILRVLKGKKHLIVGNHDGWAKRQELQKYFESIDNYLEFSDGQNYLVLSHYPMLSYHRASRKNTYMLHGHIHADTDSDFFPLLANRERILNAGVDLNNYTPVTLEELLLNNRGHKALHRLTNEKYRLENLTFVAENLDNGKQRYFRLPHDLAFLNQFVSSVKNEFGEEFGYYKDTNHYEFRILRPGEYSESPREAWEFIIKDWLKIGDYVELIEKYPYTRIKEEAFKTAKQKSDNDIPF